MQKLCALFFLGISSSLLANPTWITLGSDSVSTLSQRGNLLLETIPSRDSDVTVAKIDLSSVDQISGLMHEYHNRCGGFMVHDSLEDALDAKSVMSEYLDGGAPAYENFVVENDPQIDSFITQVDEFYITETILKLSSFKNRYHSSAEGTASQQLVKEKWVAMTTHRTDVSVSLFNHTRTKQPSVVMQIKGSENPDKYVVIGGHGDSTAGSWGSATAAAPGADDNASGIATMTEVIRVIMQNDYRPKNTLVFVSYAAEEVGLWGSADVAAAFKKENKDVIGVLQLDMTNFMGSEFDIYFMTDYTNKDQNEFLGALIDQYVHVKWGYDKCGYGCSDHASWTRNGYPASIPFESKMAEYNKKIHTSGDTLAVTNNHSYHAVKFAKLAVAYAVEMTN